MDVAVNVGAGQRKHQRPAGMRIGETPDGSMASVRMQRQQEIGARVDLPFLHHGNAMARRSQKRGPAQGSVPISGP
jgi:hypothetical protein